MLLTPVTTHVLLCCLFFAYRDCSVQFSPLAGLGRWRDMRDDSAEILFQSFMLEALVNRSAMDSDVSTL